MTLTKLSFILAGLPLLFACGGDNLTLPSEGQPAHIEILDGDAQIGPVKSELDKPLLVKVTDSQGRPVEGVTVEFVLEGGLISPTTSATNARGEAQTSIELGTQVGTLTGQARVPVDEGRTPVAVRFTAIARPSDAAGIVYVSGDEQSAPVGTMLSLPLVVQVNDGFGNPVSGVTVEWSAEDGGSVSEISTVTGENGQTSVTRTLGSNAGQQRTLANVGDLAGSPVTFTHTATAGSASSVTIRSGNNQDAPAGSELPQPLVVRVLDEQGNPIVGRAVSWVVGAGGGSAAPETSNTGPDGQASTRWTLGSAPGNNTLNAVVSGVGNVTFNATGTGVGSPSNLAIITQPPTSVTVGVTLSPAPVIQIRDAAGHDVALAGVEITAGVSSGRGQLEGSRTVVTDASGRAQFSDLRITGGTGSHKLIFAADGYRSVTSNKIEVEKASTVTSITGHAPDPSDPGAPVTVSFSVTSGAGTPSGSVEVTASGGSETCTASVSEGGCPIILVTPGVRTLTARYLGNDAFGSSSATAQHQVNPPANQPPVAGPDAYSTPSGQTLFVIAPGVLANDSDPEGSALSAELADGPGQGLVSLSNDGSFIYFPGGLSGTVDTFTYDASDGSLKTRQTVTITIQ